MESKKLKIEECVENLNQEEEEFTCSQPPNPSVIISEKTQKQWKIEGDLKKIEEFDYTTGEFEDLFPKFITLCQGLESDSYNVLSRLNLLYEKIAAKTDPGLRAFEYIGFYLRYAHLPLMHTQGLKYGLNQILSKKE